VSTTAANGTDSDPDGNWSTQATSTFTSTEPTGFPATPNITYTYTYPNSTANYCFNQSQNWVGIYLPDCDADPTNSLCSDPHSAIRIVSPIVRDPGLEVLLIAPSHRQITTTTLW